MKRNLLFLTLLFSCSSALAESHIVCPTVEEIKQDHLGYWLPLYREGEELASSKDTLLFESHVTNFEIAKWDVKFLESGHCYYEGTDPIVSQIVLAQDAWRPLWNSHWKWVKPEKAADCHAANAGDCGFIE